MTQFSSATARFSSTKRGEAKAALSAAKQRQGNVRESEHCSGNVWLGIAMFCYGMARNGNGGAWRRNDLRSIGTVWRDVAAARNGTVWQGNGYARISDARARRSIEQPGYRKAKYRKGKAGLRNAPRCEATALQFMVPQGHSITPLGVPLNGKAKIIFQQRRTKCSTK